MFVAQKMKADAAPWHNQYKKMGKYYNGFELTSFYLTMRDGVKIAIDLYLPKNLNPGEKLPTIIHQTRYFRRMNFRWPFNWIMPKIDQMAITIRRIVENGYGFVNVDVRGSGASFGSRQMEWSPDEVKDGAEIVDWIIEQSWSNSEVGTTGISYNGTAAEMLLVNQHPAVKAANIQFSVFDIYPDILRVGGVRNEFFIRTWSSLNASLDSNQIASFAKENVGIIQGWVVKGVHPVDGDEDEILLNKALREHEGNYDIYDTSLQVHYRDDQTEDGISLDKFSPHAYRKVIEDSGTPIYSWSSWYDGAYTLSAIKRFLNIKTEGSRLILGPWDHGARQNPDHFVKGKKSHFDTVAETLRFFDYHLKSSDNGIEVENPIIYYTMGEEVWKSTKNWPPPDFDPTPYYMGDSNQLTSVKPILDDGNDSYNVDYSVGSGRTSRWVTQVNPAQKRIQYTDREEQDNKLLVYDTPPLDIDVEVTGHPIVTLYIRSNQEDAQLFVYLEDINPTSDVYYVTEGVFHVLHRKISDERPLYDVPVPHHTFRQRDSQLLVPGEVAEVVFDLQPISYLFKMGHAIRLAIAGADKDNFSLEPSKPPVIDVIRNKHYPSHILLPIKMGE
jgi:putative CocE/NonD family hydrolase